MRRMDGRGDYSVRRIDAPWRVRAGESVRVRAGRLERHRHGDRCGIRDGHRCAPERRRCADHGDDRRRPTPPRHRGDAGWIESLHHQRDRKHSRSAHAHGDGLDRRRTQPVLDRDRAGRRNGLCHEYRLGIRHRHRHVYRHRKRPADSARRHATKRRVPPRRPDGLRDPCIPGRRHGDRRGNAKRHHAGHSRRQPVRHRHRIRRIRSLCHGRGDRYRGGHQSLDSRHRREHRHGPRPQSTSHSRPTAGRRMSSTTPRTTSRSSISPRARRSTRCRSVPRRSPLARSWARRSSTTRTMAPATSCR